MPNQFAINPQPFAQPYLPAQPGPRDAGQTMLGGFLQGQQLYLGQQQIGDEQAARQQRITDEATAREQQGLMAQQAAQQREREVGAFQRTTGAQSDVAQMAIDSPKLYDRMNKQIEGMGAQDRQHAARFATQWLNSNPEQRKLMEAEEAKTNPDIAAISQAAPATAEMTMKRFAMSGLEEKDLSRLAAEKLSAVGEEERGIKRETLDIRKAETKERQLDRQIKRMEAGTKKETNELRKQELEMKLEEKKVERAEVKREKEFQQQGEIDNIDKMTGTIKRLLTGGGLKKAAGFQSAFPTAPGTKAADFEATLETMQSQAFLSEISKMKGMGALSENEGKKLAAAIGSLDINMSDEALRSELVRISETLEKGKAKLRKKYGMEETKSALPQGVSEDDISATMQANNMSRQQVLDRLGGM